MTTALLSANTHDNALCHGISNVNTILVEDHSDLSDPFGHQMSPCLITEQCERPLAQYRIFCGALKRASLNNDFRFFEVPFVSSNSILFAEIGSSSRYGVLQRSEFYYNTHISN